MKFFVDIVRCITVVRVFGLGLVSLGMVMWFFGTYGG